MKNLHLIPTDKPSRLHLGNSGLVLCESVLSKYTINGQHIYITNDEEIKEGEKGWLLENNSITKNVCEFDCSNGLGGIYSTDKKIILTTDHDLIKNGVQAIDDEFLEWFVKNPSCEFVEVGYGWIRLAETDNEGYWVSIPDKQFEMQQEEPKQGYIKSETEFLGVEFTLKDGSKQFVPKQETLEEAKIRIRRANYVTANDGDIFEMGVKWQAERMYSEEDMKQFGLYLGDNLKKLKNKSIDEIFEQFKNI
jgi:hypothetical protein